MVRADASNMHELRRRFVQGLMMKLPAPELRAMVTGIPEDEELAASAASRRRRKSA